MILVLGNVVVRDGQVEAALSLSLAHVNRSRTEPGCIAHAVHRDAENPQRLVFVEKWSDLAALQAHFEVPESIEFVGAVAALATEPPGITIYEAAPVRP